MILVRIQRSVVRLMPIYDPYNMGLGSLYNVNEIFFKLDTNYHTCIMIIMIIIYDVFYIILSEGYFMVD